MIIWLTAFLSRSTRRNALALVALAVLIVIAGGIAFALAENISIWTGWYWAVVTATTVGYGDVTPKTGAGHVIAVVVMLSAIPLIGAVFALWSGAAAAAHLRRLLHLGREFPGGKFRIVVGNAPVVPAMLEELIKAGYDVVLVADIDPATVRGDVHLIKGDPTNERTLRSAHPDKAEHALVTGGDDGDVLVAAVLLHSMAPSLPLTALVHGTAPAKALRDLGVDEAISADELLSHTLAKSLESPHAAALLVALLDSEHHRLDETEVTPDMVGRALSDLRSDQDDLVLGLVHEERVILGIGEHPKVAAGDRLLVARPAVKS